VSIYPPENTLQKAAVAGGLFELYDLDLSTSVPGGYLPDFHFTPAAGADGVLPIRGGVAYRAVPVEISGFDQSTGGAPAQPTMKLGAATPLISGLLWQADDFVGAKLTRTIVCGVNLDGGADPDPAAYVLSDEFRVAQKTRHARDYLELRLISENRNAGPTNAASRGAARLLLTPLSDVGRRRRRLALLQRPRPGWMPLHGRDQI